MVNHVFFSKVSKYNLGHTQWSELLSKKLLHWLYDLRSLKKGKAENGVEYSAVIQLWFNKKGQTAQSMEHTKWTYSDKAEEIKRKKASRGKKSE